MHCLKQKKTYCNFAKLHYKIKMLNTNCVNVRLQRAPWEKSLLIVSIATKVMDVISGSAYVGGYSVDKAIAVEHRMLTIDIIAIVRQTTHVVSAFLNFFTRDKNASPSLLV